MVLQGWEVKALREGKVQLTDGYVVIREGELFLIGCQINPLQHRLDPRQPGLGADQEAAAAQGADPAPGWQGRAEGSMHTGATEPSLEERQGQVRDRAGQGQGRTRQARHHQGPRRQARGRACDEIAAAVEAEWTGLSCSSAQPCAVGGLRRATDCQRRRRLRRGCDVFDARRAPSWAHGPCRQRARGCPQPSRSQSPGRRWKQRRTRSRSMRNSSARPMPRARRTCSSTTCNINGERWRKRGGRLSDAQSALPVTSSAFAMICSTVGQARKPDPCPLWRAMWSSVAPRRCSGGSAHQRSTDAPFSIRGLAQAEFHRPAQPARVDEVHRPGRP